MGIKTLGCGIKLTFEPTKEIYNMHQRRIDEHWRESFDCNQIQASTGMPDTLFDKSHKWPTSCNTWWSRRTNTHFPCTLVRTISLNHLAKHTKIKMIPHRQEQGSKQIYFHPTDSGSNPKPLPCHMFIPVLYLFILNVNLISFSNTWHSYRCIFDPTIIRVQIFPTIGHVVRAELVVVLYVPWKYAFHKNAQFLATLKF